MRTFLLLTMTAALGVLTAVAQPAIKRLDGSSITPAGIDATVTRLMRTAEVTLARTSGGNISVYVPV